MLLHCAQACSHVQLFVTPWTVAHQAPLSLGFSRQEHWSGLPYPSPMHESEKWKRSHSVVSNSSRPHGLQPTRLLHPGDFPGKSAGVGCLRTVLIEHIIMDIQNTWKWPDGKQVFTLVIRNYWNYILDIFSYRDSYKLLVIFSSVSSVFWSHECEG